MGQLIIYSNEDKANAYKRMKNDPQVQFFNDQITRIYTLWSLPQKIKIGEELISEELPNMPEGAHALIDKIKKDREGYIKISYPELSGL